MNQRRVGGKTRDDTGIVGLARQAWWKGGKGWKAKWQRTKIEVSLTVPIGYCTVLYSRYILPRDLAFVEYATPERDSLVVRSSWPFFSAFIECQKTRWEITCAFHMSLLRFYFCSSYEH